MRNAVVVGGTWLTRVGVAMTLALSMVVGFGAEAVAQTPTTGRGISLEEALRVATEQSEPIAVARAGVERAEGQHLQARSEYFPQIGGTLGYSRALASQFEGAFGGGGTDTTTAPVLPPCETFTPDPSLPLEERVRLLEGQFNCSAGGGGLDFGNLPFGRENTYQLGLSLSQNVFTGGRVNAQNRVARSGIETAEIALSEAEAQLALDVTQAYYDAVLADRLLAIATATLTQSEATLQQVLVARQVGSQPEFELLRAQVARDNQRPVVIQRQSARDIAYLRVRQLLNIPANEPIVLTTELNEAELDRMTGYPILPEVAEDSASDRSTVRQAEEAVEVQENLLTVSRSQRLPSVSVSSQYGRVAYPVGGLPTWGESQANWTVGVNLSVPLFTGGRLRGAEKVAQANLAESRARLQQVRELAALDTRSAQQELAAAVASWEASTGTVEQAQRAFQIAQVRFREGISTQLELSDAQLLLQQAQANRAVTARNLQIARAKVALLPNLPLGAGGAGQGAGAAQQQQAPQQTQQAAPQQQNAGGGQSAFGAIGGL